LPGVDTYVGSSTRLLLVLPRAPGLKRLCYVLRSDESDDDSLLAVNYAGFAPVLVEGLKELEQQQRSDNERRRSEIDEAQDEVQRLKELAQRLKELAQRQSSELRAARDEIRSLTEWVRRQEEDIANLKELAGQLLRVQTEQQSSWAAKKPTKPTGETEETITETGVVSL